MRSLINRQIARHMSSETGSHIPKDMKGKSEAEIKKWLAQQQNKTNPKNNNTTNPNNSNIDAKNNQKLPYNDICAIL